MMNHVDNQVHLHPTVVDRLSEYLNTIVNQLESAVKLLSSSQALHVAVHDLNP